MRLASDDLQRRILERMALVGSSARSLLGLRRRLARGRWHAIALYECSVFRALPEPSEAPLGPRLGVDTRARGARLLTARGCRPRATRHPLTSVLARVGGPVAVVRRGLTVDPREAVKLDARPRGVGRVGACVRGVPSVHDRGVRPNGRPPPASPRHGRRRQEDEEELASRMLGAIQVDTRAVERVGQASGRWVAREGRRAGRRRADAAAPARGAPAAAPRTSSCA